MNPYSGASNARHCVVCVDFLKRRRREKKKTKRNDESSVSVELKSLSWSTPVVVSRDASGNLIPINFKVFFYVGPPKEDIFFLDTF